MNNPIQIMIIEDSPEYREVIEIAINKDPNLKTYNTFGAAEVALRSLQNPPNNRQPEIILLDLNLPGMLGLDAIPWITKYSPNSKVIVLSQSKRESDVLKAISLGASGYLLKSSTIAQIKDSIQTVIQGGASLDGKVAQHILGELKKKPTKLKIEKPLSEREFEILTLLSEGFVKKEISEKLAISFGSVATYIRRIYEKLEVLNAPAAVNKAHRLGLFKE